MTVVEAYKQFRKTLKDSPAYAEKLIKEMAEVYYYETPRSERTNEMADRYERAARKFIFNMFRVKGEASNNSGGVYCCKSCFKTHRADDYKLPTSRTCPHCGAVTNYDINDRHTIPVVNDDDQVSSKQSCSL